MSDIQRASELRRLRREERAIRLREARARAIEQGFDEYPQPDDFEEYNRNEAFDYQGEGE